MLKKIKQASLWALSSLLVCPLGAAHKSKCQLSIAGQEVEEVYTVKSGDTLSGILYRLSQERQVPFCLYGKEGWVLANQNHNQQIKDWHKLQPGTTLKLRLPAVQPPLSEPFANDEEVTEETPELSESQKLEPQPTPLAEPAPPPLTPAAEPEGLAFPGSLGVRYGVPFVQKDALLAESAMMGAFVRIDRGLFAGLRWDLQIAPEVSMVEEGEELSINWQRTTIGWSFGFESLGFIDRLDFVPKLGLMSVDARINIPSMVAPGTARPARFQQKNTPDLGLEVGAELLWASILTRGWVEGAMSAYFQGGEFHTASTFRGGVDAYYTAIDLDKSYKLAFLMFLQLEKVALKRRDSSHARIVDEDVDLDSMRYDLSFLGVGFAFGW